MTPLLFVTFALFSPHLAPKLTAEQQWLATPQVRCIKRLEKRDQLPLSGLAVLRGDAMAPIDLAVRERIARDRGGLFPGDPR